MPSFRVEIDIDEIMEEVLDSDIIEEVRNRSLESSFLQEREIMNDSEILELLSDCAVFLRKHGKHGMALGLDNLIKELNI